MGDPRRLSKKYVAPQKLWTTDRIVEERSLVNEYGLKNVREVWIAKAELRKIRRQVRNLLGLGEKGKKEMDALIKRVVRFGYVKSGANIDELLSITTQNILDRRLQTLVYKLGLANSIKQARQLIVHGHIALNGRKVNAPGMLIPLDLENKISYYKVINLPASKKSKKEEKEAKREEKLKKVVEKINVESESEEKVGGKSKAFAEVERKKEGEKEKEGQAQV